MKRCLFLACMFGCDGAPDGPQDAPVVVYEVISVSGQTSTIHAVSVPIGIDCGPSTTQCQTTFLRGSLFHLHIEQLDFTCGTATISRHVFEGSGSTFSVPFDQDVPAYGMDFNIICSAP